MIIPDLFDTRRQWTPESALGELLGMLDELGVDRITAVGHSFGGCFELGLAATCPERVVELVFCDTLGMSNGWALARQALRPTNLLLLATPGAALDFVHTFFAHPAEVGQAAWHGFVGDHHPDVAAVARAGLRSHVLWAERDTLLRQEEGRLFANQLEATFSVVSPRPGGKTVDHNWMYRCPQLFVDEIERLGLEAWRVGSSPRRRPSKSPRLTLRDANAY